MEFVLSVHESINTTYETHQERAFVFQQTITLLQQFLTLRILCAETENGESSIDETAIWAIQTLALFCILIFILLKLAAINESNNYVSYTEFYNQSVEEKMDLKEDYPKWKGGDGYIFISLNLKFFDLQLPFLIGHRNERRYSSS